MAVTDRTIVDVPRRGRARRRLLQLLIAATAVVGAVSLTAGPASAAAPPCATPPGSNLCWSINALGDGTYAVHVGIDVTMSQEDAQEYIDDPGDPFEVWIRGDDSGSLAEFLFPVPVTALGTGPTTLGGDFDTVVPGSWLNEDNGTDEVRAQVTLIDRDTNTTTGTFVSNRIVGNWP